MKNPFDHESASEEIADRIKVLRGQAERARRSVAELRGEADALEAGSVRLDKIADEYVRIIDPQVTAADVARLAKISGITYH